MSRLKEYKNDNEYLPVCLKCNKIYLGRNFTVVATLYYDWTCVRSIIKINLNLCLNILCLYTNFVLIGIAKQK